MGRGHLLVLALLAGVAMILLRPGLQGSQAATYRVCLDPGHDPSVDVGAVATAQFPNGTFELREVDLNLDVAHEVRRRLIELGIEVVMTWDAAELGWPEVGAADLPPPPTIADDPELADPLGLEARGALCVEAGAMAMFSVHHNSLPGAGNGLTTLFRDPGFGQKDGDRAVAEVVQATMWDVLQPGKRSRGFVDFGLFRGNWGVARGAVGIPTVILEPVVISNPAEALRLAPSIAQAGARRLQIVEAEVDAIVAAEAAVRGRVQGGSR
jgi:N-acetylmuramoyl-L-alanine amidase